MIDLHWVNYFLPFAGRRFVAAFAQVHFNTRL
jgi:hypothetical protein